MEAPGIGGSRLSEFCHRWSRAGGSRFALSPAEAEAGNARGQETGGTGPAPRSKRHCHGNAAFLRDGSASGEPAGIGREQDAGGGCAGPKGKREAGGHGVNQTAASFASTSSEISSRTCSGFSSSIKASTSWGTGFIHTGANDKRCRGDGPC